MWSSLKISTNFAKRVELKCFDNKKKINMCGDRYIN